MAFPSADGGADAGSGEGVSGADSGGRGHARGHPGEGADSGGRAHARGHHPGEGARGADSGGRGHAPGHTGEGFSLARPWEAPGLNPGQPLRWFSRLAVAIGFRPDPNKRRGYTPTPTQIAPVDLSPTQIERAELYQFKKHLDDLLKEARLRLKTPDDFETNISVTLLKPWQGVLLKSAIAFASMKRPGAIQMRWKLGVTAVDVAMENQSINSKYVRLLNEFTWNMKALVDHARENDEISAESASKLLNELRKFHTNVSMVLARDRSRFLEALQQLPENVSSLADKLLSFGSVFRVFNSFADVAYRVSQMGGDPALFDDIGKEVTDMTRDPFLLNSVYLGAMQNYSVTFGSEIVGMNLLKKMMLGVRNFDLSIFLSASEVTPGQAAEPNGADVNLYNQPNYAELHAEKLFADNIKGMLHIPYSLRNSKLELQCLQPFQSISGCIGLNRDREPSFSISSFCGVKDLKLYNVESLGFGGKLHINDGDSWINCSAGVSVSSLWCNLGLTFKQPGLFTATCSSRMGNRSTVLGGYISYSYEEDRTKFAAGVQHSVDSSMYLKSCIGSDKVLRSFVSKSFGKSRLNLVAEVNFKDFRKLSRAGIYFSFP
ncbi:hypothetical protein CFC21_014235 [Triticum aestivum]|uniref:Uncharacterized protein n=7 Tax=Triticinae TaxID=1648030 RepID=A0A453A4V8_AEGTS|nr:uncharacterized protein LOC109751499 isoform X1 [Aegilops tauschii subsp. strangulata]XP_020165969.1 uncharacterized protein LOC109751499 isoform X1 [Aegilops tauschii subsp. strangulata]XP_020165970.1 uncharacterized protein LOC109751499 isoform X1 [Aegilops tauschii subsp. strangulata]XP_020165971.1 uncharacterized protein LOC109751499 isoform X1 [Aegilops tauschii subsp. strangulata]XP_044452155.1 uncharacterized protein LOC123183409 isoform X1 [Triticum aestivum]XP_044452156.1 uncharact